jgi:hypothetical protein
MTLSHLRKAIFHLQMSLRHENENDKELLKALDILCDVELKNIEKNELK